MKETKKHKILCIFIVLLALFLCSCRKNRHNCITFINRSHKDIHVSERFELMTSPSDTFFICGGVRGYFIKPREQACFEYGHIDGWDDYLRVHPYIQFMIYSERLRGDCTEDQVKDFTEKYQLKRYQLTLEDLERINWTVVYPPEE